MKTLSRRIKAVPGLHRAIFSVRNVFVWLSWALFEVFFRFSGAGSPNRSETVRSVLHVSCLSHKPYMLSRMMREHGIDSSYLSIAAETGWLKLGERGYDYNLRGSLGNWLLHPWPVIILLWQVMRRHDVIHYHFNSLLDVNGRELPYLKRMGKGIVFHFRGCDLRQGSLNRRLNPRVNCCQECDYPPGSCENPAQRLRLKLARQYGDLFLATTPDLQDFWPDAVHVPFTSPHGVDLGSLPDVQKTPGVFRVVTSSNHPSVDGVAYVRDAVDRLAAEGFAIELVEVKKTRYEEALAIYKSADVYCGKLLMGYYNNAIIECMILGVPCICWIRPEYLASIPDCPIIVANPETVYDALKHAVEHPDLLQEAGRQSPEFIRRHHDPKQVLALILDLYRRALTITAGERP